MLRSELPLHDHVRSLQRQAWITKQASEDRSRAGKRQVGNDDEGLARPLYERLGFVTAWRFYDFVKPPS